jgi:uncharacterized protein
MAFVFPLAVQSAGASRCFPIDARHEAGHRCRRRLTMALQRPEVFGSGMKKISQASEETLEKLGCREWRTWGCGAGPLSWNYGDPEVCFLLAGEVVIKCKDTGNEMRISEGDVAAFPGGLRCVWKVEKAVSKHFIFNADLSALDGI